MGRPVSKSVFKAKALESFREIESTGEELVIPDQGKPALRSLRGTVLRYDDPLEPVGIEDWESLY